jgi:hypothetical protein
VTTILNDVTEALKVMGPSLVTGAFASPTSSGKATHLDSLAGSLLEILKKEHVCQAEDEDLEDVSQDNDDEQAEQDAVVINAAADTIAALCTVVGPDFSTYFRQYLPLLIKYYKPSRSDLDRNMAIGSIAEAASGLRAGVTEFTQTMFSLFLKGLSDEEEEVRSNSAYGMGILFEFSQMDLSG